MINELKRFIKVRNGIIFIMLSLLYVNDANAQQDPIYGQYIFNNGIINPAQSGVKELNQWGLLRRVQWVGVDGAPTTYSLFLNTSLPKKLGLSLGVYNDKIGPITETSVQADIASHVRISQNWYASVGMRFMLSNLSANLQELKTVQQSDPRFANNMNTGFYFNTGIGALLYNRTSFIGASIPKTFRREIGDGSKIFSHYDRHYFVYGGHTFGNNKLFSFSPSVLFKYTVDAPLQFDLNFLIGFQDRLDFGPMLRSKDAIGFLVGMQLDKNWYLGYMYEYPINDINLVTQQTHELSLRYFWRSKYYKRVKSPRYFL
jgi:type IX secretion system PorP/SprF family membrane protein